MPNGGASIGQLFFVFVCSTNLKNNEVHITTSGKVGSLIRKIVHDIDDQNVAVLDILRDVIKSKQWSITSSAAAADGDDPAGQKATVVKATQSAGGVTSRPSNFIRSPSYKHMLHHFKQRQEKISW